jgi:Spy/CpxP family protein refolding chaperone
MKSIRFRFLVAALAVLFATAIAKSQPADAPPMHGHEFGMRGEYMMEFFAGYLNLSDTQRAEMKGILQKEHPSMKPLMQQMFQTRQQLKQYAEGTYDEAKVRALATQQAQTEIELTVQKTRIHSELFQVLTADQQAKMKEFETRREGHMHKHMHQESAAPEQQ